MATQANTKQAVDSASTATIITEVTRMDLQDDITNKLSTETLDLISNVEKDLTPERPTKRARTDDQQPGTSTDPGLKYPPETKPLYLRSKNLHKRKLAVATKLSAFKKYYGSKDPAYTSFKCPPPNLMRNPENKARWNDIVNTTKKSLLSILIEDMEEQYQATKTEISALELQLRQHLSTKDWEEMSATLDRKYKSAVASQVQKSYKIFPQDRKKAEARRRNPKGAKNGKPGRKQVFQPRKGDDLSTLARLLMKQLKASNI